MKNLWVILALTIGLFAMSNQASAQIPTFFDDFETAGLADDASAIGNGWTVNLIFPQGVPGAPGQFIFAFQGAAPNNTGAVVPDFGGIATAQDLGGGCDDNQFYNVFNVYNAADVHAGGFLVVSNHFQERVLTMADVGRTYTFQFNHIGTQFPGNELIPGDPNVTALEAFIVVLDPPTGFSTVARPSISTAGATSAWTTSSLTITIDPAWVGDILQFGFNTSVTNFAPSGIWYDDVFFGENPPAPVLPLVAGSTCDDGNPETENDVLDANCECAGTEIAPIPTLGEWGLMLMSLLILTVGLVYIRQSSLIAIR